MNKGELMAFGTLLKFGLASFGIVVTIVLLVSGVTRKNKLHLKKAGITFLATCIVLVGLSVIEFWILASL